MVKMNYSRPSLRMKDSFQKHLKELDRYVDDETRSANVNKLSLKDKEIILALLSSIEYYYGVHSSWLNGFFGKRSRKRQEKLKNAEVEMRKSFRVFIIMILEDALLNNAKMNKKYADFVSLFFEKMKDSFLVDDIFREEFKLVEQEIASWPQT